MLDRDPDIRPASAVALRERLVPLRDEARARAALIELVATAATDVPSVIPESEQIATKLERRDASTG